MKNPFRYRSYYYDFETNLYYLNSRYYDPETGRFVNADDIAILNSTKEVLNGLNLYTYCLNNPINEVDETGYAISWLLALFISAIVFAVANTAFQLVSDVATGIITGDWSFNWEDYVGASVGGLIGGAIFFVTSFNLAAGFGAMGFAETLITDLLTNHTKKTNYSTIDLFFRSLSNAALNAVIGYLGGRGIPKLTSGKNSFMAVFKSGLTKLANGVAKKMSFKVFAKGIVGTLALKNFGLVGGFFTAIWNWLKNKFIGVKNEVKY